MNSFFIRSILIVSLFVSTILSLSAEFETFTNDVGQQLEAELIELNVGEGTVQMRLRSGSKINAALTAFSKKDQKRIQRWWQDLKAAESLLQVDSRIDITVKMNRKSKNNAYNNSYWNTDDKTKSFFPEVIITNDELEPKKGNSVRIVIVAKDLHYQERRLVVSASTKTADFPDRGDTYLEGDPFQLRLYEYDSTYSNYDYAYGYEYEGYAVVIKNANGEITHTRATKSKYLSDMSLLMECRSGEVYDEDLSRKLNVAPNSYFVQ